MRTALAFASSTTRGRNQISTVLRFHTGHKSHPKSPTPPFISTVGWITKPWNHCFSQSSFHGMTTFQSIRGGYASSDSERHASTLPDSESPPLSSSESNTGPKSEFSVADLMRKEIDELADECQKKGIASGLEKSKFGDWDYVSTSSTQAQKRHRVIFVLGGPGAGKGTQCENIVSNYKSIHHFSVGELLRNVPEDSQYAELIQQCLVAGKIVPVEISLSLLRDAMDKAAESLKGEPIFLVDGFPRNFDNLSGWVKSMPEYAAVLGALVFDCPMEELERRILDRGKTSGRSDDNLTSARKRFHTFQEQTMPVVEVLEILQERGEALKVFHIAGEKTREEVWVETQNAVNDYIMGDILSANAKLMDVVENKDLDGYLNLCDVKMLTAGDEDMMIQDNDESNLEKLTAAFQSLEVVDQVGDKKQKNTVTNAKIEFHDNAAAMVSYDRSISLDNEEILSEIHETRVWKQGENGWKNVHFIRGSK